MINVNKPFIPEYEDYINKIKTIWDNNHLTNYGPLEKQLSKNLSNYLEVEDLCLLNNCTNGLLTCLNEFDSNDEIITTPFSFIATTSSIIWSKLQPVFCDIDPEYLFIDIAKIEEKITNKTKAVLATHIYGNSGDLEFLEELCKNKDIKLIFDAAHAFGVKYDGKSILKYGDYSVLSFHSTKVYHTIEGGAIYAKNKDDLEKMKLKTNFGFKNFQINEIGINSKMSEFNAAMGLCCLENIDSIIENRKKICLFYDSIINFQNIKKIKINEKLSWNYSYYPIILENEAKVLDVMQKMNAKDIIPRRYFYPSLNLIKFTNDCTMPVSEDISKRILCLPLYYGLSESEIEKIASCI